MTRNLPHIPLLLALAIVSGCDMIGRRDREDGAAEIDAATASVDDLRRLVADQQLKIERLERDLARTDEALQSCRKELESAQSRLTGVMEARKQDAREFNVTGIELGMLTGGANFDDRPGDDGVIAWVYPVDGHGDTVKRAGSFELTVFDFKADGAPVVARKSFPPETNQEHWVSFPSSGYRFRVPWEAGPPLVDEGETSKELMLKVVFRDLDGRIYKASEKVTYHPPGKE